MSSAPPIEPFALPDAEAAFARAAAQARRIAAQTGTPLAVWHDGRVVLIAPDAPMPGSVPSSEATPPTPLSQ